MVEPDFVIALETMTAMFVGMVAGGFELLPGRLIQVLPHAGNAVPSSNPLNPFGAEPPLIGLFCDHCEPQKFTLELLDILTKFPITN